MTDGRRTAASSLRALAATRAAARDQADELLLHVPVVGDLGVQRLLDGWVEQAADTLRAVSEAAEERLLELGRSSEPYARHPSRAGCGAHGRAAGVTASWSGPMTLDAGDPPSVSALGGALRTQAARLGELVHDLARPAAADRGGRSDATALERDLVTRTATELDRVGELLQSWTTTAVETSARVRALEPELDRWDLFADGRHVVDRPGPSRVDPGRRLAERERLQELLNRATASRSRELARLARELERSSATLAALSDRARTGH